MAREIVNVGSAANDRQGDSLRDGGAKINRNFAELYEVLGGDSSAIASAVTFSDSGAVFNGITFNTVLGATEGSSNLLILLPDSDGTIVTTTATQTLTNKTLTAPVIDSATINTLFITDADQSHQYIIQPSNLSSNRTATLPALTGNDTFVFNAQSQTLSNKTLASPKVTTGIFDNAGAELIKVTATASAVNEITVANAAAGNDPAISATGNDTNISLGITPKGNGAVNLGKVAFSTKLVTSGDPDTTTATVIIGNPSTTLTIPLLNGNEDGEYKILINRGSANFVLNQSGSNFALPGSATTITISTNGSAQLVWASSVSKWFMIGSADSADSLVSLS
jgi:hypothetical protein